MKKVIANNPILRIAIRHLFSKKKQTAAAILGVTFGVAACIFQAGIITGIQTFFVRRTIDFSAHIRIYNDGLTADKQSIVARYESEKINSNDEIATKDLTKDFAKNSTEKIYIVNNPKNTEGNPRLRNGYQIMQALEKDENVLGVAPFLGTQVIIRAGVTQTGAKIAGIDVERENFLFNVQKYMIEGKIAELGQINNGIVLGAGLAANLGIKTGGYVVVSSQKGVILELKVVGINRTGVVGIDDNRAYLTLGNAQKLLNVDANYITDINMKIKEIEKAATLATQYQRRFNYNAEDWIKANEGVFAIFKLQNLAIYVVIASMMLVAGFGIFNILTMIIYEKMPDIAILKAIGYNDKTIRYIFLTEALCIGFLGGVFGLILGFLVSTIASNYRVDISRGILAFDYLPINFNPYFYLSAFVFGLLITALAGYFPAKKASEVDPITIIRGK
jgi:lipoprotein-releasing system permease protein